MNLGRLLIALAVILVFQGQAQAAPGAQPTDAQKAEASLHFRRGVELFQEEAYRAALVEFERAYEIAPDYRLLYNVGQTKLRLQDYLGVVQAYEAYMSAGGAAIPQDRRAQVEEALVALRDRVGRLAITCNRAGAEVVIDDITVGRTPLAGTIPVNVGRHRVLLRTADGASDSKVVNVAGGDISELSFKLSEPSKQLTSQGPVQPAPQGWSPMKKGAVATWSTGAALLISAAVTGALAMGKQNDLERTIDTEGASATTVRDEQSSVETLALTTDVLIGAGAAAVVVGTILWMVDRRAHRHDKQPTGARKVQVGFGPNVGLLRGSF